MGLRKALGIGLLSVLALDAGASRPQHAFVPPDPYIEQHLDRLGEALTRPARYAEPGTTLPLPEAFCDLVHPDLRKYARAGTGVEEGCRAPIVQFNYKSLDAQSEYAEFVLITTNGNLWGVGYTKRNGGTGILLDTHHQGFDMLIPPDDLRCEDQPTWTLDKSALPNTATCTAKPQ